MTDQTNEASQSGADQPAQANAPPGAEQVSRDLQAVNEQLLLAGLREQRLADQLRHQLAFTAAITSSLGEGVYALDRASRCTFVNPAAEQMLGRVGKQLRGQHVRSMFPAQATLGPASDAIPAALVDVLDHGVTRRDEEAQFVRPDGALFATAYSAAPIRIDGQVVGAVITFRDMTNVRQLQRMREEYLALLSHDLRAPLTTIQGRAELLLRWLAQQGLAREADSAKIVVESSRRMNDLIEELLDRTRADAHTGMQHRAAVDLRAMVERMIEQTVAPAESARVMLDATPAPAVVVEVAQVERVIVNLLSNALKFSPAERPIAVRIFQQAANVVVSVTDQGRGIAPEDLPHLFEKHYRARSVGHIAGNGLGLYGSRLIIEAHSGQIWAESTLGAGSSFMIALPLLIEPAHGSPSE